MVRNPASQADLDDRFPGLLDTLLRTVTGLSKR
jgi:hypothetical protein